MKLINQVAQERISPPTLLTSRYGSIAIFFITTDIFQNKFIDLEDAFDSSRKFYNHKINHCDQP